MAGPSSRQSLPRKGMPSPRLPEGEFRKRFRAQFTDPAFAAVEAELEKVTGVAWDAYKHSRKAPITRKAGPGFADPGYDLSVDWIAAHEAILARKAAMKISRCRRASFWSMLRRAASTLARARCRRASASSRSLARP